MNPITLLTNGVNELWFWTYGIVAGWGLTVTLVIGVLIVLTIRQINIQKRITKLEQRVIMAERDYNLTVNDWKNK
jgi:hypothetical protein